MQCVRYLLRLHYPYTSCYYKHWPRSGRYKNSKKKASNVYAVADYPKKQTVLWTDLARVIIMVYA